MADKPLRTYVITYLMHTMVKTETVVCHRGKQEGSFINFFRDGTLVFAVNTANVVTVSLREDD